MCFELCGKPPQILEEILDVLIICSINIYVSNLEYLYPYPELLFYTVSYFLPCILYENNK